MGLFSMGAPASAPYPASQYPASSFFGAANLAPGGANARDDAVDPAEKRNIIIVIIAAIVLGYAVFHFNYIH
jgi:hypothetical protein